MARVLAMLASAGSAAAQDAFPVGDSNHRLSHGGRERTFIVHVPASARREPSALVFIFHGYLLSSGSLCCANSQVREDAARNGYIAVCPDGTGLDRGWNAGGCCGSAQTGNVDDVGFASAMIDYVNARARIPAGRTFASGMSNGGMMSYRLGCELSDKIHGVGCATGEYTPGSGASGYTCNPAHPRPMIHFHGTNDGTVGYSGALNNWRRYSQTVGCTGSDTVVYRDGSVECFAYESCPGVSTPGQSMFCRYEGMGHTWPGSSYVLPATPTQWAFWNGAFPSKGGGAPGGNFTWGSFNGSLPYGA